MTNLKSKMENETPVQCADLGDTRDRRDGLLRAGAALRKINMIVQGKFFALGGCGKLQIENGKRRIYH
jgi:hypothetical protein